MRRFLIPACLLLFLVACSSETPDVSFMVFGDAAELAAYESLVAAFTEAQADTTSRDELIPRSASDNREWNRLEPRHDAARVFF